MIEPGTPYTAEAIAYAREALSHTDNCFWAGIDTSTKGYGWCIRADQWMDEHYIAPSDSPVVTDVDDPRLAPGTWVKITTVSHFEGLIGANTSPSYVQDCIGQADVKVEVLDKPVIDMDAYEVAHNRLYNTRDTIDFFEDMATKGYKMVKVVDGDA